MTATTELQPQSTQRGTEGTEKGDKRGAWVHPRTVELLKGIGLKSRELQALRFTPLHKLPVRPSGFGLQGTTGVGKTWSLVQLLASDLDAWVRSHPDPATANRPPNYALWVNWPDQAEALKGQISQNYHAEAAADVERWSRIGMLFLDDIGQERITGQNDFALGSLRAVLDARHRDSLPVFWTSNLTRTVLAETYGARIFSRMLEAWPPLVIRGEDLRLKKVSP